MFDKTLAERRLPAPLVIKNFVQGELECNYEKYLLELVNKCSFFLSKSNGKGYEAPTSESNGECDCISEQYHLDFKLLASKTELQATSVLSDQIILFCDGCYLITKPKIEHRTFQITFLHKALRDYDFDRLCAVRLNSPKKQGIENDICDLLDTLETKKHLLLFYPYIFSFANDHSFEDGVSQIIHALSDDFEVAMQYRHEVASGRDTYLAFIYDGHLVFLQEKACRFNLIGAVELSQSPVYMKLSRYTSY